MRYERTDSFKADFQRLSRRDRELFRTAVRTFNEACDTAVASRSKPAWPASLRVKSVQSAPGIWEMTFSFSGPDGRATFEWTTVTIGDRQEPVVRWRRIGDHRIFARP